MPYSQRSAARDGLTGEGEGGDTSPPHESGALANLRASQGCPQRTA